MTTSRMMKALPDNLPVWGAVVAALLVGLVALRPDDCSATGASCGTLAESVVRGIMVGGMYSLVALGLVIINKASGVFNFAHGYMMLAGGMFFMEGFSGSPSSGLAAVVGVLSAIILLYFISASDSTQIEGKTRLEKIQARLTSQRFLIGLAVSIAAGAGLGLLYYELDDPILRGALGAFVGSIALGMAIERFTIRPLLGKPILAAIMMTLAAGLLIQGFVALIWGKQSPPLSIFVEPARTEPIVYTVPDPTSPTGVREIVTGSNTIPSRALPNYSLPTEDLIGKDISLQRNLVWGFGITMLSFIGFVVFFQFTSVGLAMRAVAENQTLAESVGLRVRIILAVAWAIASTMAMLAGVVQSSAPGGGVSEISLVPLALRAFPAVLLGGLDSITGALVGGLIIGVVEQVALVVINDNGATAYEFAPFAVLLVVLLFKPEGLFGQKRIDRV